MLLAAALRQPVVIHVQLRLDADLAVALRWLLVILAARLQVVQVVVVLVLVVDQAAALKWLHAIHVLLLQLAIAVAVRSEAADCSRRSSRARRSRAAMQVHAMLVQLRPAPAIRARHQTVQLQHLRCRLQPQHQVLQLQLSIQVLT